MVVLKMKMPSYYKQYSHETFKKAMDKFMRTEPVVSLAPVYNNVQQLSTNNRYYNNMDIEKILRFKLGEIESYDDTYCNIKVDDMKYMPNFMKPLIEKYVLDNLNGIHLCLRAVAGESIMVDGQYVDTIDKIICFDIPCIPIDEYKKIIE